MVTKKLKVTGNSESGVIPVRRRNAGSGRATTAVSITLPNELNQTINGLAVTSNKTRSLVIAELIKKGLEQHE